VTAPSVVSLVLLGHRGCSNLGLLSLLGHNEDAARRARAEPFHDLKILSRRISALLDREANPNLYLGSEMPRGRGRADDLIERLGTLMWSSYVFIAHAPLRAIIVSSAPTRAKLPATVKSPIMAV